MKVYYYNAHDVCHNPDIVFETNGIVIEVAKQERGTLWTYGYEIYGFNASELHGCFESNCKYKDSAEAIKAACVDVFERLKQYTKVEGYKEFILFKNSNKQLTLF